MNAQKFTQKSLEAINDAQSIAIANQNMNIEQEHLLLALLKQEGSLTVQLLKKMDISAEAVTASLENHFQRYQDQAENLTLYILHIMLMRLLWKQKTKQNRWETSMYL